MVVMVVLSLWPEPGALVGFAETGQTVVYRGIVSVVILPMGQLVMVGSQLVMVWMAVVYTVEVVISTDEVVMLELNRLRVVVELMPGAEACAITKAATNSVAAGVLVDMFSTEVVSAASYVVLDVEEVYAVLELVPVALLMEALMVESVDEDGVVLVASVTTALVLLKVDDDEVPEVAGSVEVVEVFVEMVEVVEVVVVWGGFWPKMRISLILK